MANMARNFRQHPAVLNQASKVFVLVAQALEAETLRGQTASRVVTATKALLQAASVDPTPLLQQFQHDAQAVIMSYFA
ncbi:hypothetical protein IMZ48_11070 [Candidatus Bathyarchaeota archaeon]|nr:hypothetical protein [Candidatus Bathyarchaeota archaeon]